jgi:hypothetical protein
MSESPPNPTDLLQYTVLHSVIYISNKRLQTIHESCTMTVNIKWEPLTSFCNVQFVCYNSTEMRIIELRSHRSPFCWLKSRSLSAPVSRIHSTTVCNSIMKYFPNLLSLLNRTSRFFWHYWQCAVDLRKSLYGKWRNFCHFVQPTHKREVPFTDTKYSHAVCTRNRKVRPDYSC